MPIPSNAKKVFKGILYDVYHWEQELFDGTIDTFEGLKRKPSVQVIAVIKNKIILLEEEQPNIGKFLAVPGGVFEKNETPEDAAKRELLEETGCASDNMVFWKKHDFSVDIEWGTHYFIAKNCKKVSKPTPDAGEKINVKQVSFKEFLKKTTSDEFRNKHLSNIIGLIKLDKEKVKQFKKELFE